MPISPLRFGTHLYTIPTTNKIFDKATKMQEVEALIPLVEGAFLDEKSIPLEAHCHGICSEPRSAPFIKITNTDWFMRITRNLPDQNSLFAVQRPTGFSHVVQDDSTVMVHLKSKDTKQEARMAQKFESLLNQNAISFTKSFKATELPLQGYEC